MHRLREGGREITQRQTLLEREEKREREREMQGRREREGAGFFERGPPKMTDQFFRAAEVFVPHLIKVQSPTNMNN